MKQESPIEEIWRIRDQLGAEEDYDVHRLFERLRREQQSYADRLVQPPRNSQPRDREGSCRPNRGLTGPVSSTHSPNASRQLGCRAGWTGYFGWVAFVLAGFGESGNVTVQEELKESPV